MHVEDFGEGSGVVVVESKGKGKRVGTRTGAKQSRGEEKGRGGEADASNTTAEEEGYHRCFLEQREGKRGALPTTRVQGGGDREKSPLPSVVALTKNEESHFPRSKVNADDGCKMILMIGLVLKQEALLKAVLEVAGLQVKHC
ncbi:hypothetical protein VNO77_34465 [Canavalia gladiata]|uniref:Uncharacterized protein n=1 Tax=Canavalia gladiata TaxID=3824 RepID=A0AAN9KGL0_CANGL